MAQTRVLVLVIVGLMGALAGSVFTNFANARSSNVAIAAGEGIDAALPGSDERRIVDAVKRVQPSVVALTVSVNGQSYVPADPLGPIFGVPGAGGTRTQPFRTRVSGSGFVYNSDGLIITNAHVVTGGFRGEPTKIDVTFQNGDHVPATLVSANVGVDLAIIKVDHYDKLPPPLQLGNSDKLEAGQWAIAIGEPLELRQSVTLGIVSGFNRVEVARTGGGGPREFKGLLQTSAAINAGNSGGPLVGTDGMVIGVNQLAASPTAAQAIGFAIPSNTVRTEALALSSTHGITQGTHEAYIGANLQPLNEGARSQLGYKTGTGVVISQVISGGPADLASLEPGDVITAINGKVVRTPDELLAAIKAQAIDATVKLHVWSAGKTKDVTVKLVERPANADFTQRSLNNRSQ